MLEEVDVIQMAAICFEAESTDENGGTYNCPFLIQFPMKKVRDVEIQYIVNQAIEQFHELHPNGTIIKQFNKTYMSFG